MKTKLTALALFLAFNFQLSTLNTLMAQRPSKEDMEARRGEMVEKRAEKLAKDFNLKGEEKDKFVATFKAYQKELMDSQIGSRGQGERPDGEKKKLSDEEAQKMLDECFTRQEKQIANMQTRLEIEKKYYAELQKTLTPQQLVRVFRQRNERQGQRPGGQHGGYRGGPQGGFGGGHQGGFGGPGGASGGDF